MMIESYDLFEAFGKGSRRSSVKKVEPKNSARVKNLRLRIIRSLKIASAKIISLKTDIER